MSAIKLLDQILAKPTSLEQERVGEEFLINEQRGDSMPSSGNLTTMMMLKSLYADDAEKKEIIDAAVAEETTYLLEAMNILSGKADIKVGGDTEKGKVIVKNLQAKYGRSIEGAAILASLLRRKANELEFDEMINPAVKNIVDKRLATRNSAFSSSSSS